MTYAKANDKRAMAMSNDITDIIKRLEDAAREAFERGYEAGAKATLDKIVRAATGNANALPPPVPPAVASAGDRWEPPSGRVERGAVRRVLRQVMSASIGRTIPELGGLVKDVDARIAPTSIPNELRRNIGTVYRQDGDKWFLIGSAEKEAAGTATNDHPAAA